MKSDIEILSIALGDKTHQLFKIVMSCEGVSERLKTVFSHSVQLKIEILKWLFTTNTEFTNKSNRAVVRLVISQYQAQLDEINDHEQKILLKTLEEKKSKRPQEIINLEKKRLQGIINVEKK